MFNHYGEGDRILTNEPCLNCTCHNSMLMCYLRVCPFTKPIGQDCTIEKKPDQCCPVISCPEEDVRIHTDQKKLLVPVSLVTPSAPSSTTQATTSLAPIEDSTDLALLERGCEMNGKYFSDGAQVDGDPSKPCELCYCIRNRTACVMQECILHVEGCEPIFQPGVCC
ncbi:Kielin/chordin-like protein, partial [Orchesella cincta]